ncbi:uncharacterized protein LOC110448793 [Mizuhopecten yessoensis]|uniref:uncharacterized protein LOC110448793 n=1 Tax=Mizuhopecten yessoensis TaxID=6573 RepID=UPI000B458952|nr:uncharacterized protein LOC110448793 [Mizuhopecten yessoensis]
MATKYVSSKETTNFARISRLIVDICCDLLRSVLDAKLSFTQLDVFVQSQQSHLYQYLDPNQRRVLFPRVGKFTGTSKDLDFTLLYKLFRHLLNIGIPPHNKGWGKIPDSFDTSLSANIDRLRVQRNEVVGHLPKASLSDTDFSERWIIIRQCVFEIEKDIMSPEKFVTDVDALLTMCMDPATERQYIEKLEKQRDLFLEVKDLVEDIKGDLTDVTIQQRTMATDISDVTIQQRTMAMDISDVTIQQRTMAADISDVTIQQKTLATDISDVKIQQRTMATDISDVTIQQRTMATGISDVTIQQRTMATDISDVTIQQKTLKTDMTSLKDDVNTVKEALTSNRPAHRKDPNPKIAAMIDITKEMVKQNTVNKFIVTQGFQDAKEKLLENRVVVVKGNTGDGKTATVVKLLYWMCEEQPGRQPLQIHNIEDLDSVSPKSQYICLIDDIFGTQCAREKDLGEWDKRVKSVLPILCGNANTEANFIVITVRNEVFNYFKNLISDSVFTDSNIIDLSCDNYKIAEEQMQLLKLYTPTQNNFTWTETEMKKIVECAPCIGFPQCCRLFRDIPALQKDRVNFFQMPFQFLENALSKLRECTALLFLFLNGGNIKEKGLDPNGEKVSKILLVESFEVDLMYDKDDKSMWSYKKKIGFVKDSLETLLGFLVVKEKQLSGDVYKFYHDSIHATVALLYGRKSLIGYIKYSPKYSLGNLNTSKMSSDSIVISPEEYTYMYERLLRELECIERYDVTIGSLDVWHDGEFLNGFVRWLSDKNVDKLGVLNNACSSGAEKCALHLLSSGVKPDMDTPLLSLIKRRCYHDGEYVDVLKKVVVYLNDEMKLDLLNKACCSGPEVCAKYLLSEDVECDKNTPFFVVKHGSVNVLATIVSDLNDKTKLAVLNVFCYTGSEECVSDIISRGVKPDLDTARCVWMGGSENVMDKIWEYLYTKTETYTSQSSRDDGNVLHLACRSEIEEFVTGICEKYPKLIQDGNESGQTPLHVAAQTGNCGIFHIVERFLLKSLCRDEDEQHKCELEEGSVVHRSCACAQYMNQLVDMFGKTVLHVSCEEGHMEICKYLWKSYPSLTRVVNKIGWTVLHVSCEKGHLEICKYLCESYPALTTAVDKRGWTVLHMSCATGYMEICKYLCESYPSLTTVVNKYERTVLHASCLFGHMEICKYLCESYPALTIAVDKRGGTVLHMSCVTGYMEICKYLCESYPSLITDVDKNGMTVLHAMAICKYLCESYPALTTVVDKNGMAVLHASCAMGHTEICKYLCESYPSLTTAVDKNGGTVLHVSCEKGHMEICKYLCETYPALTTVEGKNGKTVFHASCEMGQMEICKSLCESYPALITAVDKNGMTVLHASCFFGHMEICKYLCESYPSLTTAVDKNGMTVLHASCAMGHMEICKYL